VGAQVGFFFPLIFLALPCNEESETGRPPLVRPPLELLCSEFSVSKLTLALSVLVVHHLSSFPRKESCKQCPARFFPFRVQGLLDDKCPFPPPRGSGALEIYRGTASLVPSGEKLTLRPLSFPTHEVCLPDDAVVFND